MLCNVSKFTAAIARYTNPNAQFGVLTRSLFRRCIFLLHVAICTSIMLPPYDAYAHSGQFHHGGMGNGHFNGGSLNKGHFHGGNFANGRFPHHSPHGRIIIISPLSGYYPPPVYYYSPPVAAQTAPMTFIEQESDGTTLSYWYYCADSAAYYPYVQQCPSGWQIVQASSY